MNPAILLPVLASLAAMVLAVAAVPLMRRLAPPFGMLDSPGAHKTHATPTPLLGGCALAIAVLLPLIIILLLPVGKSLRMLDSGHDLITLSRLTRIGILLAGALGMHLIGLVDDRHHLGPWSKLAMQIPLITLVVLLADVRILTLTGPIISVTLSVLWIGILVNAFNFLDNMDGLACGVAAICTAALLAVAALAGQPFETLLLAVLLGALVGYFPFNAPPAKIFMGDAGSLLIGYLLGVGTCLISYAHTGPASLGAGVLMPLVIMAVPLYDMLSVILLRIRLGENPMVGDNRHFSHRLVRRGMSPATAVATICLCAAATALGGVLLAWSTLAGTILIGVQTVLVLLIIALLEWSRPLVPDPKRDG
jgi:UDP-GlcNAc:undecaprenyl-phosphate/decaprenyl-phosphate GlcNAc-1-phosphate transferase